MRLIIIIAATGFLAAALLAGCANNDGLGLTTASLSPTETAAKPSIDPACVTLAAKINDARAEGTPGRVAEVAAAQDKPRIVNIKRTSLAKVTELDAMNKEFQARCSTVPTEVAAAPPQPSAAETAASKAAGNVAATAATSGTKAATKAAKKAVTAQANQPILAPPTTR